MLLPLYSSSPGPVVLLRRLLGRAAALLRLERGQVEHVARRLGGGTGHRAAVGIAARAARGGAAAHVAATGQGAVEAAGVQVTQQELGVGGPAEGRHVAEDVHVVGLGPLAEELFERPGLVVVAVGVLPGGLLDLELAGLGALGELALVDLDVRLLVAAGAELVLLVVGFGGGVVER